MSYHLEGKTFHRLTVLRYQKGSRWECQCQCGKVVTVLTQHLMNGRTKSCGCWKSEVQKHRTCHWSQFTAPEFTYTRPTMLSYLELVELVHNGVITEVTPERINAASIDLTLGSTIFVEKPNFKNRVVDLAATPRQYPDFRQIEMTEEGYLMYPGCFLLAATQQVFNLPNYIQANYFLNSSLARAGLNAALAMMCDPGWHGSHLTLELTNWTEHHPLRIRPGMKIGQMVFNRVTPVPEHRSYSTVGSYNNAKGPVIR